MELNGNESSRSETVDCAPCLSQWLPRCFQASTTIKPFKVTSCLMKRRQWEFASHIYGFEVLNHPQNIPEQESYRLSISWTVYGFAIQTMANVLLAMICNDASKVCCTGSKYALFFFVTTDSRPTSGCWWQRAWGFGDPPGPIRKSTSGSSNWAIFGLTLCLIFLSNLV